MWRKKITDHGVKSIGSKIAPASGFGHRALTTMGYAIMQKELVVPDLGQLKRAFTVLPQLTDMDAQTVVHDAYGIIMRGLDLESAGLLQSALQLEGVHTEVIDESKLPSFLPAKVVHQIELGASHLTLYDPMKRVSEVPWGDIMLLAAGLVRTRGQHKVRELETIGGTRSREEVAEHLVIEIFLNGGTARYSVNGDDFIWEHLGARMTGDKPMNFVLTLAELSRRAPQAGMNRGAFLGAQDPPELFPYPSRQMFNEELTWMFWRIGKMQGGAGEGV